MATFENTVVITRPIEEVFAFLSDLENVPKWNYAIVETRKVSEGPVGQGTVYRQVRSVPKAQGAAGSIGSGARWDYRAHGAAVGIPGPEEGTTALDPTRPPAARRATAHPKLSTMGSAMVRPARRS